MNCTIGVPVIRIMVDRWYFLSHTDVTQTLLINDSNCIIFFSYWFFANYFAAVCRRGWAYKDYMDNQKAADVVALVVLVFVFSRHLFARMPSILLTIGVMSMV